MRTNISGLVIACVIILMMAVMNADLSHQLQEMTAQQAALHAQTEAAEIEKAFAEGQLESLTIFLKSFECHPERLPRLGSGLTTYEQSYVQGMYKLVERLYLGGWCWVKPTQFPSRKG